MRPARLALALLLTLALTCAAWAGARQAEVVHVNDGDTITVRIKGRRELVRLIGVDAPESGYSKGLARRAKKRHRTPEQEAEAGKASRQGMLGLVKEGDAVVLVDGRPQSAPRDRYGRLLAFVYLPDGRLLNQELIAQGWARVYQRFEFRHKADFLLAEKEARKAKRGLWAKGGP
ncbi:MAG: thermonuclease family protein [Desulfarculaceae bacterium]|nr:thermonuclease family protein [Desulfarculaceae bacterium]MCF8070932.1 thermonuclease family protein [Desulfarculaceae bacterium]MCF8100520.1 thermonuclease family protein [Desulfarculaceae bacterium]MCF8116546.1 thermonuclease family protein [Desulfarculaceae bacterium]